MKFARLAAFTGLGFLAVAGCSKGGGAAPAAAPAGPSPFDKRWEALQQQSEAIRVVDDKGAAMMDNVLGAQSGALAAAPWMAESMKGGGQKGPLPEHPDATEIQKLVRQYVPGVKSCYQRLTREGDTRTGKAIVSFQIGGNGRVQGLSVEAPAFEGSQLATCIDNQVARWVFPPSKNGAPASSYPFVFVGG
jgi:hypothetical protein